MTAILFDQPIDDDQRRARLYAGDIFVYSANEHSTALVELAREMIREAFPGMDPALAQFEYSVEDYAAILMKLKPAFIHHPECKKIIPRMFEALGCDLDQTYFDVPRMRSSTSDDYLTSGIALICDHQEWNAKSRFAVDKNVKADTRPQPKAQIVFRLLTNQLSHRLLTSSIIKFKRFIVKPSKLA